MSLKVFSSLGEAKRGRPRKNPAPEGHEGGEEHGPEGMEMKLRKASDYITLGKEAEKSGEKNAHPKTVAVQFGNGKTHDIPHEHIHHALKTIESWKGPGKNPDERMKKLADMDKSHEHFLHHIGKMPELKTPNKGSVKEEVEQVDENNDSHTHAAHFKNSKGEWAGMALIDAKSDADAVNKAHELSANDKWKDFKLDSVEKHVPVKEAVAHDSGWKKKEEHKDASGNVIKHVARSLAKKGMKAAEAESSSKPVKEEAMDTCKEHGKYEGKTCSKCKAIKEEFELSETVDPVEARAFLDKHGLHNDLHPNSMSTDQVHGLLDHMKKHGYKVKPNPPGYPALTKGQAITQYHSHLKNLAIKEEFELEEKQLSRKQKKIAALAGDPNKIDAEDLKVLRNMKDKKNAMKESVYTAANRYHAVESAVRAVMAQNRNLKEEAKLAEWNKNNPTRKKDK